MTTKIDLSTLTDAQLEQELKRVQIYNAGLEARLNERMRPTDALAEGDLLTLNNIIWPFMFSHETGVVLANGGKLETSVNISREASFILTHITKVVFEVFLDENQNIINMEYIDPLQDNDGTGDANGLMLELEDGSSSRRFMDKMIPLDVLAVPERPFVFPKPQMFQPSQNIILRFSNENPNRHFVPFLILHGVRLRLDGRDELFDLITT